MTQLRLLISGKVQGVFFRQSTKEEADRLGVNGWVRNLSDGKVEAVVKGRTAAVAELVEWCQHGPERARVFELDAEADDSAVEARFVVRR